MLTRGQACFAMVFCVLAWSSTPARAADAPTVYDEDPIGEGEPDHKLGLMLNPLDALVGVYGGEADIVLGRHLALQTQGAFYSINGWSALALGAGLLIYPLRGALHGWYVDPQVTYVKALDESPLHFDLNSDVVGFGVTSGWQWTWDYGFSVRVGGGAMYYGGGAGYSGAIHGAHPVLDGSIGWAF